MKRVLLTLLVLFASAAMFEAKASHAAGMEITYEAVPGSPGCYEVTLKFYRDCDGISAPTSMSLSIESASCNLTLPSTTIDTVGHVDITPICPGYSTTCDNPPGSWPGIEEWTYQGIVCLPDSCNDWIISASVCCRNAAITNLTAPSSDNIYVETLINNDVIQDNNSPVFSNPPVPFICAGQLYCYNNGAFDPDGDSLVYSIADPLTSAGNAVSYLAPYTSAQPFDGVTTFDPVTGNLCVTPNSPQVTVLAIVIEEYRNGVLIGSVVRDVQVNVQACPGTTVPQLTGFDGVLIDPTNTSNTQAVVCPGITSTFQVSGQDVTTTDNLTLSILGNLPPGMTVTYTNNGTPNPVADFTWTPMVDTVACFTVNVKDDGCPIFTQASFDYCITVSGPIVTLDTFPPVCVSGPQVLLNGGFPAGGVFTGTGVMGGFFMPSFAGVGFHDITYTYQSPLGCVGEVVRQIEVVEDPWAGNDGFTTLCTGDSAVDMFALLSGSPQPGGVWKDPNGNIIPGGIVNPSVHPEGAYTYTVSRPPCQDDESVVVVNYNVFPLQVNVTNESCYGASDGQLHLVVNSGVNPFQYSIDGGLTYQSGDVFMNLPSGDYPITILDGNNCGIVDSAVVLPSSPQILVSASAADVVCSGTNSGNAWIDHLTGGAPAASGFSYSWYNTTNPQVVVGTAENLTGVPYGNYYVVVEDSMNCQGSASVLITQENGFSVQTIVEEPNCQGALGNVGVQVTGGGTPPFTYSWNTGNPADTLSMLTSVSTGSYTVYIVDAEGCDTTMTLSLLDPPTLMVDATVLRDVDCHGDSTGIAKVDVSGGVAPYAYFWSSGHVSDTAWNLWSNDFTVSVVDAKGCQATDVITIQQSDKITADLSSTPASCYGASDGTAMVSNVSGGVQPYLYAWSTSSANTNISSLTYGQYMLIVTDSLGCIFVDSVLVKEPQPLQVGAVPIDVSCYGAADGSLEVTLNGGESPYQFEWSQGGTILGTSNVLSSLSPGSYTLDVTDAKGCQGTAVGTVSEPDQLAIHVSSINPAYCQYVATGDISVVVSGGTLQTGSDYQYLWDNPWPAQTTAMLSNQEAGDYILTVTDDNGCEEADTINIPLVPTFTAQVTDDSTSCFGVNDAEVEVSVAGGYGPYTHTWNFYNLQPVTTFSANEDYTVSGASYGAYSVVVLDVNGCEAAASGFVAQPDELLFQIDKLQDQSCIGDVSACDGAIELTIEGGNSMYTYEIFDASMMSLGSTTVTGGAQITETISTLCEGYHTIEVTDENNCLGSLHINTQDPNPVEILAGTQLDAAIDPNSVGGVILCYGDQTATATILAANPLFTYDWFADGVLVETNVLTADSLPGGLITATANYMNCVATSAPITIAQPAQLQLMGQQTDVSCYGENDGAINTNVSGGTPGYTYAWSNAATTANVSSLSPGNYSLNVVDDNGCEVSTSFTIGEPSQLNLSIQEVGLNMESTVSGGVAPYDYEWKFNNVVVSTSANVTPDTTQSGYYNLTVIDDNGCVITDAEYYLATVGITGVATSVVSVFPNPTTNSFVVESQDLNSEKVSLLNVSGKLLATYHLNEGKVKVDLSAFASGVYMVEVISEYGSVLSRTKVLKH
jgi:hypothetical protein